MKGRKERKVEERQKGTNKRQKIRKKGRKREKRKQGNTVLI